MNILEQKEIGKPLATYIRDLANPDRPIRSTSWKSADTLPTTLQGKKNQNLSPGELQTVQTSQEVVQFNVINLGKKSHYRRPGMSGQ